MNKDRAVQPIFALDGGLLSSIHSWEINDPYSMSIVGVDQVEQMDIETIGLTLDLLQSNPSLRLSVNVRMMMLVGRWAQKLCLLLGDYRDHLHRLTIELIEHGVCFNDANRRDLVCKARDTLVVINGMGVRLSIDDYGTGNNSAEIALWGVWDEVKIDRTIIDHACCGGVMAKQMIHAMTEIFHEHGLQVVFEGIEDQGMMDFALDFGADAVQGYHIYRPVLCSFDQMRKSMPDVSPELLKHPGRDNALDFS